MSLALAASESYRRERRRALALHPTQLGIDYVEVAAAGSPDRRRLVLHFIPPAAGFGAKNAALAAIGPAQVRVRAIEKERALAVVSVTAGTDRLEVEVEAGGNDPAVLDQSGEVVLSGVPGLDPFFDRASFSFRLDLPAQFDPASNAGPAPPAGATAAATASAARAKSPLINYLARDFGTFRSLMLERLVTLLPAWREENPADGLVTVVEVLAHAADELSYFQDAVATEAYLGTARRRISVRRHARLLDYRLHEGTNTRVWAQVKVTGADPVILPADTELLTRVAGQPARLDPGSGAYRQVLAGGALGFRTMEEARLFAEHGELSLYAWGAREATLEAGATRACLLGDLANLAAGEVLVFEQLRGAATGLLADADPKRRHAVRLERVTRGLEDPLGGALLDPPAPGPVALTEIAWLAEDALPFDLPIARPGSPEPLARLRGNLVLAERGEPVEGELVPPGEVPAEGRHRPRLERLHLTHRVPFDPAAARGRSAAWPLEQDPRLAEPAIELEDDDGPWRLRRDLLSSDRFDRDFVVEMEDDGRARLRFGQGAAGRAPAPGSRLTATYRVGGGSADNIGPGSLAHVVSADTRVFEVDNPMAGRGGTDPESLEQVRLSAPLAFCTDQPCLTAGELTELTLGHPAVRQAAVSLRWTGSWYTLVVGVELAGGRTLDQEVRAELADRLESVRQAGYELEIAELQRVGLDIALTVEAAPDAVAAEVEQDLLEAFGSGELAGGGRGFFHPANLELGQPVYLSKIVAAALAVPGALAIDFDDTPPKPNRFRRYGQPPRGELEAGRIRLRRLEIPRVDNDPERPERGRIRFFVRGGR
jgi:hypothetical protein